MDDYNNIITKLSKEVSQFSFKSVTQPSSHISSTSSPATSLSDIMSSKYVIIILIIIIPAVVFFIILVKMNWNFFMKDNEKTENGITYSVHVSDYGKITITSLILGICVYILLLKFSPMPIPKLLG